MFPDSIQKTFSRLFNMSNFLPYGNHLVRHTGQQTMTKVERPLRAEYKLRFAYEQMLKTSFSKI